MAGACGARGGNEDRLQWRGSPPCRVVDGAGVMGWDGSSGAGVGGAVTVLQFLRGAGCGETWKRGGLRLSCIGQSGALQHRSTRQRGGVRLGAGRREQTCRAAHDTPTPPRGDAKTETCLRATGAVASCPTLPCTPGRRGAGGREGGNRDHPGHGTGEGAPPRPPAPPCRCRARGPARQRAALPAGGRRGRPTTRHAGRGRSHGAERTGSGELGGRGGREVVRHPEARARQ